MDVVLHVADLAVFRRMDQFKISPLNADINGNSLIANVALLFFSYLKGVVSLPSGLLYKVLKAGSGKTPQISTPCECHYKGTLIDGSQFDSSYDRGEPTTFAPNQVIKGWTEAMQLMKEGSKWELYIPSELAYGDRGAGGMIPGGAALVFIIELLKVKGPSTDDL